MFVIFSVFYILIAAAMIVLILLQNGAGADAGSGFGGGASATVFGARGSATFLTRATGILAGLFFLLSLGMGIYLHSNGAPHTNAEDLGVMGALADKHPAAAKPTPAAPTTGSEVPAAPAATNNAVPAAQPAATPAPTQGQGEVPAAPAPPAKH
ncbi:preprotein translocase subunit SecG [Rhodanobacter denitrificans]|uniref:Protein-export membrane protein SecG n=1 Tax=Rhodanobacter denitrificans TaxID=666685 RepID=A0A368KFS1_9GAMM|nr:preprotein translocase subunit SecG [Rhodanobacter denitrificans]RCS30749.1 preprotein translocase subunit SecG [Rhodanobacter denitrificans]